MNDQQPPAGTPDPGQQPPGSAYPPPPNPYAQQQYPYAQPGPQPNPYGVPSYQPAYGGAGLPDHPSATTALVLGLVGLVGILFCGGLTLVLAPFAWATGSRALQAIDAEPGRYGGREKAAAGRVMGIIGTVLLALGIVLLVVGIGLLVAFGHSTSHPEPVLPTGSGFANS